MPAAGFVNLSIDDKVPALLPVSTTTILRQERGRMAGSSNYGRFQFDNVVKEKVLEDRTGDHGVVLGRVDNEITRLLPSRFLPPLCTLRHICDVGCSNTIRCIA